MEVLANSDILKQFNKHDTLTKIHKILLNIDDSISKDIVIIEDIIVIDVISHNKRRFVDIEVGIGISTPILLPSKLHYLIPDDCIKILIKNVDLLELI